MCCRCVWDIFNLGVHRRMFAYCSALFGDISSMVFGVQPLGENFNACIEIFLDIPMSWRSMAITRVHHRSFAEPLVHGGAGLAMPKFVHCESIGRQKASWDRSIMLRPRETVALCYGPTRGKSPLMQIPVSPYQLSILHLIGRGSVIPVPRQKQTRLRSWPLLSYVTIS